MELFTLTWIGIFGLAIGSFLSVCIYRIPFGREKGPPNWDDEHDEDAAQGSESGEQHDDPAAQSAEASSPRLSICYPRRSICPSCNAQLLWWHNIPVVSWCLLGGKCAFCKAPISMRYPLVELLSAFFALLSVIHFGLSLSALVIYLFCCALIVISFIDIEYYIIPDVISLPGTALGLALGLINQFYGILSPPLVTNFWQALIGVAVGAGVLWGISAAYLWIRGRIGLGLGDVKMLALAGAFFGFSGAFYTMFIGSLLGSFIGLGLMLVFGKKSTHQLPFGPYLALGSIIYIFGAKSLDLLGGYGGLF